MKKFKLMLVAFMAMLSVSAFADTPWATTTFKYTVNSDKEATITGFVAGYATASMATVTIPNTLPDPADESKSVFVFGIQGNAFQKNANITKVVIEATKMQTLNNAFVECANLAEIDFSKAESLTAITAGALAGTKLTALDLSKTKLETVNKLFGTYFAFTGTYTDVTAAAYNAKLPGAVSTATVKSSTQFENLADVKTVYPEIATDWTLVAAAAEDFDTKKLSVDKYNKVTGAALEVGDGLSEKRVKAYNDALPNMVGQDKTVTKYTADEAKAYNAALTGAVKAGDEFNDPGVAYSTLTIVTLPETWKVIKEEAFLNCTGLATINFGTAKVTTQEIEAKAFQGTVLTKLDFTGTKVSGILPANLLVKGTNSSLTEVVLTEAIKGLNGNFAKCTKLTAIDLTNIAYANFNAGEFAGSGLTEITIPATYQSIPASAFKDCTGLAKVTFAPVAKGATWTFTLIDQSAFANTAITSFTVPNVMPSTAAADQDEVAATYYTADEITEHNAATDVWVAPKVKTPEVPAVYEAVANGTTLTEGNTYYTSAAGAGEFEAIGTEEADGTNYFVKTADAIPAVYYSDDEIAAHNALPENVVWDETTEKTPAGVAAGVMRNAFADCTKLTSFTYKPATIVQETAQKVVSDKVFLGCEDGITFYTVKEYAEAATVGKNNAPTHSTFSYETSPSSDPTEAKELTAIKFKNGNNKYFLKYNSSKENIKIAKANAKVYAAYNADDDATIVMQQFKTKDGYYHIALGDNVMIISDAEKIPYEISTYNATEDANANEVIESGEYGQGSSWLFNASRDFINRQDQNMLQYISAPAGIKRSVLEDAMPAGYNIFAWSNTTSATGWLKITSGTTFPQKTMYIYAKPTVTAEGARIKVIWLDENGNIEDETTAIQSIATETENENGETYNLAGQKVNASYKGLVIKNGKKYMK